MMNDVGMSLSKLWNSLNLLVVENGESGRVTSHKPPTLGLKLRPYLMLLCLRS